LKDLLYRSFSKTRGDQIAWRLDPGRLRILCYHGICDDRYVAEPWLPTCFVTESEFEAQLQYLQRNANVLPLADAVRRLADHSLPPRSVSITFDDGYANNLYLAQPLLQKYGMSATVFLATRYIESGEMYPFVKLKLIQLNSAARSVGPRPIEYKSNPLDLVMQSAMSAWAEVENRVSEDQRRTLRPLTISEVQQADAHVLHFGAHSHTHCILKNESPDRRRNEVAVSIRKVREWTGHPANLFAYPNGESGDFSEIDKEALRAEGVRAAVTGIAGANSRPFDPLELRRYPVSIGHDRHRFRAELAGLRSVLQSVSRRLSA